MLEMRVIGSGWLTFTRDDPKVKLFDGYMVIFDQSQLHDVIIWFMIMGINNSFIWPKKNHAKSILQSETDSISAKYTNILP